MRHRDYGYKVCYRKRGESRYKVYLVTNTRDSAEWSMRWYTAHAPPDRKTEQPLTDVTWAVLPVTRYLEYKRLWHGCPF